MDPTAPPIALRQWIAEAVAVLSPVRCAGCDVPDAGVCSACRAALVPGALIRVRAGALEVTAALDYGGVAARLLSAVKEQGRADALPALSAPLGSALRAALRPAARSPAVGIDPHALLVTVPSARRSVRRRGFRPVDELVRRSGAGRPVRAGLALVREVEDQAGLGVEERTANLDGALRASARLAGRRVLIVDDVLTTGATLLEARRALIEAGALVEGAVCLAYTRRRDGRGEPQVTPRRPAGS